MGDKQTSALETSDLYRSDYGAAAELHDFQSRGLGNVRLRTRVAADGARHDEARFGTWNDGAI